MTGPRASQPRLKASVAVRYPGDAGIAQDPAVVFHEGFESGQLDQ